MLPLEFKPPESSRFHQNLFTSSIHHTAQLWHNLPIKTLFEETAKGKVIIIKYWKKLQNVLERFLKLNKQYILKMTNKLEDANTASKSYWTIINQFLYNKKISMISPLLFHGNFVSDFNKKDSNNLFKKFFFTSICIPSFSYRTNCRIIFFHATEKNIRQVKNSLDPTKTCRCDNLSVRMIKMV